MDLSGLGYIFGFMVSWFKIGFYGSGVYAYFSMVLWLRSATQVYIEFRVHGFGSNCFGMDGMEFKVKVYGRVTHRMSDLIPCLTFVTSFSV